MLLRQLLGCRFPDVTKVGQRESSLRNFGTLLDGFCCLSEDLRIAGGIASGVAHLEFTESSRQSGQRKVARGSSRLEFPPPQIPESGHGWEDRIGSLGSLHHDVGGAQHVPGMGFMFQGWDSSACLLTVLVRARRNSWRRGCHAQ